MIRYSKVKNPLKPIYKGFAIWSRLDLRRRPDRANQELTSILHALLFADGFRMVVRTPQYCEWYFLLWPRILLYGKRENFSGTALLAGASFRLPLVWLRPKLHVNPQFSADPSEI
jgi:hypothetical protein